MTTLGQRAFPRRGKARWRLSGALRGGGFQDGSAVAPSYRTTPPQTVLVADRIDRCQVSLRATVPQSSLGHRALMRNAERAATHTLQEHPAYAEC